MEIIYDSITSQQSYQVRKQLFGGEDIFKININDMFPSFLYERANTQPQYFEIAPDGTIYFISGSDAFVIAPDGGKLFETTSENSVFDLFMLPDGRACVKLYEISTAAIKNVVIDLNKKSLGEEIKSPVKSSGVYNETLLFGADYDCYIKNDRGIFGYNDGDGEPTKLLDWINSDVLQSAIQNMYIVNKDCFIYAGYDSINQTTSFVVLNRIPDDEVSQKTLIHLAYATQYIPDTLSASATSFNKNNKEYRVVLVDYSQYNNENDSLNGEKNLVNDIFTEKDIDIVLLSTLFSADKELIKKGVFTDLYKYIDNDPDLSRDKFLGCIFDSYEQNGTLPQLITKFSVTAISGKTANLGGKTGWTIDDFITFHNSLKADQKPLDYSYLSKSNMLYLLLSFGYTSFVDYEKNECSFDSEDFKRVLKYCNDNFPPPGKESPYSNEEYVYALRSDKIMLNYVTINSFVSYFQTKFEYDFEPVTYIGYPANKGNGARLNPFENYGILQNSPVRDGAWEFVKHLATSATSPLIKNGFPSYKEALIKMADDEMKYQYAFSLQGTYSQNRIFTDENGNILNNELESFTIGNETMTYKILGQEVSDELIEYLDNIKNCVDIDREIYRMVSEETDPYFAGDKTLDETVKVIQSKVSTYINERN